MHDKAVLQNVRREDDFIDCVLKEMWHIHRRNCSPIRHKGVTCETEPEKFFMLTKKLKILV